MPPLYYLVAPRVISLLRQLLAPVVWLLTWPIVLRGLRVAQVLSYLALVWAIGYFLLATFGASWANLPLSLPLPSLLNWSWR